VQHDLQMARRFFNSAAKDFFDELFQDLDEVVTHYSSTKETSGGVVLELPIGFRLFRGRICHDVEQMLTMFRHPLKHVGPPPH
jgi:hypothetical protein